MRSCVSYSQKLLLSHDIYFFLPLDASLAWYVCGLADCYVGRYLNTPLNARDDLSP